MLRRSITAILMVALLGIAMSGMARGAGKSTETLEVLCAPAMRSPIEEILARYQRDTGVRTQISFDASNIILGQLRLRSHGDVFVPADRYYIDKAVKTGLAKEPRVYAYLVPVIMVQKGNPRRIRKLADLVNPKIRVGLVDERTGAIGNVSNAVFKKNRIDVRKVNVVYRANKVDELANAIKLRSVDAVIVWRPVAMQYSKYGDIVCIPCHKTIVITVSAAVISTSSNKAAARNFLKYLSSKTGKAILARHNYQTSDPRTGKSK